MKKLLISLLCVLLMLNYASAFTLEAPEEVEAKDDGIIKMVITNNSEETKALAINFFAAGINPEDMEVSAPEYVSPHSEVISYIKFYNDSENYKKISSTLEVELGDELETREISLVLYGHQAIGDGGLIGAFLGMGAFGVAGGALFVVILLIIILALILVATSVVRNQCE